MADTEQPSKLKQTWAYQAGDYTYERLKGKVGTPLALAAAGVVSAPTFALDIIKFVGVTVFGVPALLLKDNVTGAYAQINGPDKAHLRSFRTARGRRLGQDDGLNTLASGIGAAAALGASFATGQDVVATSATIANQLTGKGGLLGRFGSLSLEDQEEPFAGPRTDIANQPDKAKVENVAVDEARSVVQHNADEIAKFTPKTARFFMKMFKGKLTGANPLDRVLSDHAKAGTALANLEVSLPGQANKVTLADIVKNGTPSTEAGAPPVAPEAIARKTAVESLTKNLTDYYNTTKGPALITLKKTLAHQLSILEKNILQQNHEYTLKTLHNLRAEYRSKLQDLQVAETSFLKKPENAQLLQTIINPTAAAGTLPTAAEIAAFLAKKHQAELAAFDLEFGNTQSVMHKRNFRDLANLAYLVNQQDPQVIKDVVDKMRAEAQERSRLAGHADDDIASITLNPQQHIQLKDLAEIYTMYKNVIQNKGNGQFAITFPGHFSEESIDADCSDLVKLVSQGRSDKMDTIKFSCKTERVARALYKAARLEGYLPSQITIENSAEAGKKWDFADSNFKDYIEQEVVKHENAKQQDEASPIQVARHQAMKARMQGVSEDNLPAHDPAIDSGYRAGPG